MSGLREYLSGQNDGPGGRTVQDVIDGELTAMSEAVDLGELQFASMTAQLISTPVVVPAGFDPRRNLRGFQIVKRVSLPVRPLNCHHFYTSPFE